MIDWGVHGQYRSKMTTSLRISRTTLHTAAASRRGRGCDAFPTVRVPHADSSVVRSRDNTRSIDMLISQGAAQNGPRVPPKDSFCRCNTGGFPLRHGAMHGQLVNVQVPVITSCNNGSGSPKSTTRYHGLSGFVHFSQVEHNNFAQCRGIPHV